MKRPWRAVLWRKHWAFFPLAVLLVLVFLGEVGVQLLTHAMHAGLQSRLQAPVKSRTGPVSDRGRRPRRNAIDRRVGFASSKRLADHYAKHGREFGNISQGDYLRRAQNLRDAPVGGDVIEAVRRDGVASRFGRRRGEFVAFDRDGTIRTFFRPNDGEAYFRRQAKR